MSVALGAAIAVLTGIGAGLGISFATAKAVDALSLIHISEPTRRS